MKRRDFLAASGAVVLSHSCQSKVLAAAEPAKLEIQRAADDRFELTFDAPDRPFRILQITDTHFGTPSPEKKITDKLTVTTLKALVEQTKPDLLFHTGDFVNNDKEGVTWEAIEVMNSLGVPWSHVLGNHDVGFEKGSLSIDEFRSRMRNASVGHFDRDGKREYAFRLDVRRKDGGQPRLTLLGLDSGYQETAKHVSSAQIEWLGEQAEKDGRAGVDCLALTMVHIPVIQFETMRAAGASQGNFGEKVCFETDTGNTFEALLKHGRVRAVFSGHDHANDYVGPWKGIELVYGRVSGWSGYGTLPRGGRLIEVDLDRQTYVHRLVVPARA